MKTLRPFVSSIATPIAIAIGKTGISPNAITIIGTLLSVGVAAYIALIDPRTGGLLSLVAGAFDMLDGALARAMNKTSKFGAFLDSTLDRVSEGAILFGIAWYGVVQADNVLVLLAFAAFIGSVMVSYARARAEAMGATAEVGLLDRPARVILIGLGLALNLAVPALAIIVVFTTITVIQRIVHVRRQFVE